MKDNFEKLDDNSEKIIVLEDNINAQNFFDFIEVQSSYKKDRIKTDLVLEFIDDIKNKNIDLVRRKALLSLISQIKKVEIYRLLEDYSKVASEEIKDWALLAYAESNAQIRKFLTNEEAIIIVSGLGGKNNKVRFFTLFFEENKKNFESGQIDLIKTELKYLLEKYNFELEKFKYKEFWISFTSLFSLDNDEIEDFAKEFIEIIRGYGIKLSKNFLLNNVEELDDETILKIFEQSYNNGAIKMPLKPNLKPSFKTDDVKEIKKEVQNFLIEEKENSSENAQSTESNENDNTEF